MKKGLLMVVIFLCLSLPAFAQDTLLWTRTYGGSSYDEGYFVQQTTDGGYIVVGRTYSFGAGGGDFYLIKTNSTGDTLWTRTYGGSNDEWGHSVQQTTDEGYIVAGVTWSFGAGGSDVYLIKTNSTGDTLWTRTYGGSSSDEGWVVQQTTDGGYIVTGYTSFGTGGGDVYLIKTDSTGDTLWTRTYGGSSGDWGISVQQTTDGGYIVTGATRSFGAGSRDFYLIKTDSTGDTLWTRTYGGSNYEHGWAVQQTTDGGYIVMGGTGSFGAGGYDAYLIKTNSTGDTLWTRTYGGSNDDWGNSVQLTTDGGYIVAGVTWSFGAGQEEVYLIKTDSLGDTLWSRTYGKSYDDGLTWVQQTTDGGYIVLAWTRSFGAGGSEDVMLTKLDSLGNTCIGKFVSSTVMSVSPTVTSPATEVTSPATEVTSPPTIVTSPATQVTTVCVLICGDVNGDGGINLSDVIYLANYLLKSGDPPPDPIYRANPNGDGVINLADVIYLANYLIKGGPAPYGCGNYQP